MPTRPRSHSERQRAASLRTLREEYDKTQRRTDPRLRQAKAIRSSARWQRVRALKLSRDPLCEDPYGHHAGQTMTATEVDHRLALRDRPDLAWTLDNLASLCGPCHDHKSAAERRTWALLKGH
jgi:5-methylcytosine-specific restriction endonuclease McrA